MSVVYAVCVANYEPREVLALYDNIDAARAHASALDAMTVTRWEVASAYWPSGPPPQYCVGCGHVLERNGHEWRCEKRCRCRISGCVPGNEFRRAAEPEAVAEP